MTGGNRPSFLRAAPPDAAERLYERFAAQLAAAGVPTKTGRFAAHMRLALVNDGPVTIVLSCPPGGKVAWTSFPSLQHRARFDCWIGGPRRGRMTDRDGGPRRDLGR